jgi:hypothetical protein
MLKVLHIHHPMPFISPHNTISTTPTKDCQGYTPAGQNCMCTLYHETNVTFGLCTCIPIYFAFFDLTTQLFSSAQHFIVKLVKTPNSQAERDMLPAPFLPGHTWTHSAIEALGPTNYKQSPSRL